MIRVTMLNGNDNSFTEMNRIRQVKSVAHLIAGNDALVQGGTVHQERVILHSPRMVEIVFAAGSVKARRPGIFIDKNHLVAFPPPAALEVRYRQITSNVVSLTFGLQDDVVATRIQVRDVDLRTIYLQARRPARTRVFPAPMSVKIGYRLRQRFSVKFIVDVKVLAVGNIILILDYDFSLPLKRHWEIAIKSCTASESVAFLGFARNRNG